MKTFYFTLLIAISAAMQAQTGPDTLFRTVARRLQGFQTAAPTEKLYVHQDRTCYMAGETVWFKVYQSIAGSVEAGSGVVYVEIADGENRTVAKTKWQLAGGAATGHIELPDTLKAGNYQLRAYTRWMQNFDTDRFFAREIEIVETQTAGQTKIETDLSLSGQTISALLRFPEQTAGELRYRLRINGELTEYFPLSLNENRETYLDIVLPDSLEITETPFITVQADGGERTFAIPRRPAVQLAFLPEGGNCVAGLPSKMAFLVTDSRGHGIEGSGTVTDDAGNEVRRFQSDSLGMGSFNFIPEADREYVARWEDSNVAVPLPPAYRQGIVMETKYPGDKLRIILKHNLETRTPFYLTVHQEGTAYFNGLLNMDNAQIAVDIPAEKLPEGIFTVTVYDGNSHAWCERLAMVNYPEKLDLKTTVDRETYGKRTKVTVQVEAKDAAGRPQTGDFSLAAVRASLDNSQTRDNFYTHYFLLSELRGEIDNPAFFMQPSNRDRLNLLLMTRGWRRYVWDEVMADKPFEAVHPAETGLGFSGSVALENKRQKPEDVEVTAIFRHDSIGGVVSFQPGENGLFMFTDYHFTDTAEVVLSAKHKNRLLNLSVKTPVFRTPDHYDYGKKLQQDDANAIAVRSTPGIDERVHDLPEVGVTAKRPSLRSYIALHDTVFILHSYTTKKHLSYNIAGGGSEGSLGAIGILYHVPGVSVRNNGHTIRVTGSTGMNYSLGKTSKVSDVNPVFILDGQKVTWSDLKAVSPQMIDRVEVLNATSAMVYDRAPWGGAIVFHTKNWDGMVYSTPTKTLGYKFAGYNQAKEFFAPNHGAAGANATNPDRRNTLHWQPTVALDKNGKTEISFFTSDDAGAFTVHCEGRSADGIVGTANCAFSNQ
jgi:hypothetical protein